MRHGSAGADRAAAHDIDIINITAIAESFIAFSKL
jgi:hypothetical protein